MAFDGVVCLLLRLYSGFQQRLPESGRIHEAAAFCRLQNASVVTTLGFWMDSPPLDVQGFNVYHKNRLIKVGEGLLDLLYPISLIATSLTALAGGSHAMKESHGREGFQGHPFHDLCSICGIWN